MFEIFKEVDAKIKAAATYIAIDADIQCGFVADQVKDRFVFGDLGSIPLRDNVADGIWLINVFSGGGVENYLDQGRKLLKVKPRAHDLTVGLALSGMNGLALITTRSLI